MSYQSVVLATKPSALRHYWRFQTTTGSEVPDIGSLGISLHKLEFGPSFGTVVTRVGPITSDGGSNLAHEFDGTNDYYRTVTSPTAADVSSNALKNKAKFTIKTWFEIDSLTLPNGETYFFTASRNNMNDMWFRIRTNVAGVSNRFDGLISGILKDFVDASGAVYLLSDTNFNNYFITFDGSETDASFATGKIKLYKNGGTHVASMLGIPSEQFSPDFDVPITLGKWRNGNSGILDGAMDETAVWDDLVTPAEMDSIFSASAGAANNPVSIDQILSPAATGFSLDADVAPGATVNIQVELSDLDGDSEIVPPTTSVVDSRLTIGAITEIANADPNKKTFNVPVTMSDPAAAGAASFTLNATDTGGGSDSQVITLNAEAVTGTVQFLQMENGTLDLGVAIDSRAHVRPFTTELDFAEANWDGITLDLLADAGYDISMDIETNPGARTSTLTAVDALAVGRVNPMRRMIAKHTGRFLNIGVKFNAGVRLNRLYCTYIKRNRRPK